MILVLSDLHIGRSDTLDPALVARLIECVKASMADLEEVVLLGDVFDSYLEYRNQPDPIVDRVRPLFHLLASEGIQISYHVGNHDPWHLTYFETEFGISVETEPLTRDIESKRIYFSHGDEEDHQRIRTRVGRHFMRRRIYYWLYRTFLPRNFGQALPKIMSRHFEAGQLRTKTIEALSEASNRILDEGSADVVIFGHSHFQCEMNWESGSYFNSGSWFDDLSYLEIWPNTILTKKWKPENIVREGDDKG